MAAFGSLLVLALVGAEFPTEAPIIPDAQPLEDPGRYRSVRSYEETLDFYRRVFLRTGGVRWRSIVNLPSIKAKHVASLRRDSLWQGLNIYEKDGEARIYVLPRIQEETSGGGVAPAKKNAKTKSSKKRRGKNKR